MSEEDAAILRRLWNSAGEKVANDPRTTEKRLRNVLGRIAPAIFSNADVALGLPVYRDLEVGTLRAIADLVHVGGLQPLIYQNFEIACCREYLVDFAIQNGFRRLLFLDSDTVVDLAGLDRLMKTMDDHDVAMVGAPVRRRNEPGKPPMTNVFMGAVGDMRALTDDEMPTTLVPFPCHYVGLAVALLDLEKISKFPGPRFARRANGYEHMTENWLFCRWLEAHELDFLVDPAVRTSHEIVTSHVYAPPVKQEA